MQFRYVGKSDHVCTLARRLETLFATLDVDHDGVLTREELLHGLEDTPADNHAQPVTESGRRYAASMPELVGGPGDSGRQRGVNAKAISQSRP